MTRVDCLHAATCGGCAAIELDYAAQLEQKRDRVSRALARYDSLRDLSLGAVVGADPIVGYRTRAKLAVSGGRVGLYREGTHDVVDIPSCRVLAEPVAEATRAVRALLASPPGGTRGVFGALLAIDAREAIDGEGAARVLLTLVLDEDRGVAEESLRTAADEIMDRAKTVRTVAVSARPRRSPQLLGKNLAVVRGAASAPDAVCAPGGGSIEVLATPGAFTQAHRGQAARIRDAIRESIALHGLSLDGLRVVDAYAGSGALGLAFAKAGARVTLVESFAPAMELARRAAENARLASVETRSGDAAAVLGALAQGAEKRAADVVVLNPPRRGVAPEAREAVVRLRPSLLFYVSCEPETLARDLAHFALLGYAPAREGAITAYDMIPLTSEVETLACLTEAAPPSPRILVANDDLVAVDKAPHEPTTPHPEHPGSLLSRVQALPGFARAAPLHRLDIGTSGVCLFARTEKHVAPYQEALGADGAHKEYRVLARAITRDKGVVRRPLPDERGVPRDAVTRYRRIAIVSGHSLLAVRIETGRTHQIRKHLASLGHPVVGDRRYGHAPTNRHFEERYGLDRPFLHAARVELDDPLAESRLSIEAPLAPDLEAVLDRLHRASG